MARRTVPKKWPTGLIEVAPGVYAYVQGGGPGLSNAGVIVGDEGVIAVDALFFPRMTRAFLRAIRRASKTPITHIVNTHHHADHIGGNQFFGRSQIVAHVNCRAEMARVGIPVDLFRTWHPSSPKR